MQDLLAKAERLGALLKARRQTIAVSESSSGGLVSAALLAPPGASAYFQGGAVVYTQRAREVLLGISKSGMEGTRSVSEAYAQLVARTVRNRFDTVWGLAETGAAGPDGNRYGDAAGHTCIAYQRPGREGAHDRDRKSRPCRQHARLRIRPAGAADRGHRGDSHDQRLMQALRIRVKRARPRRG